MTHEFDREYWDEVWDGDRGTSMGTSPPNPHLVEQVGGLVPGTALEAGCGAGAEAIWLAGRGWQVTAVDVAAAALARAAERAEESGVAGRVRWIEADLSVWEPDAPYDLVTTHYAHPAMPQLDFYQRLAQWVAPSGTLLIVGHLHRDAATGQPPPHGPGHGQGHGQGHGEGHGHGHQGGPPAEASATAATITALLDPAQWEVVTATESERTLTGDAGRETTLHDVVVRASRARVGTSRG